MSDELDLIETVQIESFITDEKAAIDIQVSTAKKYPRNITRAIDNAIAIATMDKETAETCTYSVPRAGKNISGPSVHLARIIAQNWQNLRVESKVVSETSTQIISESVCFDLETNYAVKVQVRKSIMQNEYRNGQPTGRKIRMSDDMVVITGNAANAIAYRNAVFAVIPKSVTDKVYKSAKNMITGDLSSEEKLIKRRKQLIDGFIDNYNVSEFQIVEVLGLNSINQIKQDEVVRLVGIAQAIKDGDTTVNEVFYSTKKAESDRSDAKANQIIDKIKESKLKDLKVSSLDEARKFFEESLGVIGNAVTDDKIEETAKQNGFKLIITK